MQRKLAVVGLGYIGLPVAVEFASIFPGTVGFDVNPARVKALKSGEDWTGEVDLARITSSGLHITSDPAELSGCDVFIVCVPTPIHKDRRPDLNPLRSASETVGKVLRRGGIVVYESTVYPGVTEEFCGPILARVSGLEQGRDFKLAYSPERINPGDTEHSFIRITKVVSGEDAETTKIIADLYGRVVKAGIHTAPSIKVAEAAKVIENTQRDLNIALMNEIAIICDLLNIRTHDVLAAAGTKWNFLRFTPGLVGGHCIGVDPYYLTSKAQELGYHPEVILAGRRINDSMGAYIARRVIHLIGEGDKPLRKAKVGILGLTFKEDVPDIRNSRVPDIIDELKAFGIQPLVCDPFADAEEVEHEYGIKLNDDKEVANLDALVLAVPHKPLIANPGQLFGRINMGGALIDVKSALRSKDMPPDMRYWSL